MASSADRFVTSRWPLMLSTNELGQTHESERYVPLEYAEQLLQWF
jgi:hypothetical protein